MRYLLQDISPENGLKTVYIDIKTIELNKNQSMFQKKIEGFKVK